jgi:hypothetical protein
MAAQTAVQMVLGRALRIVLRTVLGGLPIVWVAIATTLPAGLSMLQGWHPSRQNRRSQNP